MNDMDMNPFFPRGKTNRGKRTRDWVICVCITHIIWDDHMIAVNYVAAPRALEPCARPRKWLGGARGDAATQRGEKAWSLP